MYDHLLAMHVGLRPGMIGSTRAPWLRGTRGLDGNPLEMSGRMLLKAVGITAGPGLGRQRYFPHANPSGLSDSFVALLELQHRQLWSTRTPLLNIIRNPSHNT